MLWALTKPLFDASTDLGAIAPVIVFTRYNFFGPELITEFSCAPAIFVGKAETRNKDKSSMGTRMPVLYWPFQRCD
jgi:hypothetical protein